MRLDSSVRRRLWLQNLLFLLLFSAVIVLLAWLSVRFSVQADWTAGGRNTLSLPSRELLARLDKPIRITAYVHHHSPLRDRISRLFDRYRRYKPDMHLMWVNPDLAPDQARQRGITTDGELYVEYGERNEKLQRPSEQTLTRVLQRLSRRQDRRLWFLTGHGERKPQSVANHDLGAFGRELDSIGIQTHSLDLSTESLVPLEAGALVIASPQKRLPPHQLQIVLDYVRQGGHLLWLLEPDDPSGLQPLAALLGITVWPGVVVDADTPRLGIGNPAFIPIADYGPHPVTASLRLPALLPQAVAFDIRPPLDWKAAVLLESQPQSWTEMGSLEHSIQFDPGAMEQLGPLTVGAALFRPLPVAAQTDQAEMTGQQRLVIIGDGDFLSDTYLGNGANLELGLNIVNWLLDDEVLITLPPRAAPDSHLNLSDGALALLAAFFLVIAPAGLLATGWIIGFQRRRR